MNTRLFLFWKITCGDGKSLLVSIKKIHIGWGNERCSIADRCHNRNRPFQWYSMPRSNVFHCQIILHKSDSHWQIFSTSTSTRRSACWSMGLSATKLILCLRDERFSQWFRSLSSDCADKRYKCWWMGMFPSLTLSTTRDLDEQLKVQQNWIVVKKKSIEQCLPSETFVVNPYSFSYKWWFSFQGTNHWCDWTHLP